MDILEKIMPSIVPFDERGKAGMFACFLIYLAVYLKDISASFVSATVPMACIGMAFLIGVADILLRSGASTEMDKLSKYVLFSGLITWFLSVYVGGTLNFSSYYLAIPCAFVIVNTAPRFFLKLLIAHFIVSLLMQAFEYTAGEYLFTYVAADGDVLDEKLFGGSLDIMRAKGMFQGPLSAVAFAYWLAFIFRGSILFSAGLLFVAFFATGRLGMSVGLLLLIYRSILRRQVQISRWKVVAGLAILGLIFYGLFKLVGEDQMRFITSAYDLDNDQNVSRIYFWGMSVQHFLTYSPIEMLFGRYGYIIEQQGGTENDFLRLLLDNGILGFSVYFIPLLMLIGKGLRKRADSENFVLGMLIMVLMNVFPFVQSLSSSLLYWLFIFMCLRPKNIRPVLIEPAPDSTESALQSKATSV